MEKVERLERLGKAGKLGRLGEDRETGTEAPHGVWK